MISAQDIDFGVTAAPAYTPTTIPTSSDSAPFTETEATGSVATSVQPVTDVIQANPRTVLDPDLNVYVAEYRNGSTVAFQVPSRNRIEAYQAMQNANWTQQTVIEPREIVESLQAVRDVTHNAGDGVAEQQGAATVTAAAVAAASSTVEAGTVRREDNSNPSGRPVAPSTVQHVDLEG